MRNELGIDTALADAPRDQLRVLAAQIDDENRPLAGRGLRPGLRGDLSRGDSAAPS